MMNLTKHIPNAITCGNLFCGTVGIVYAFSDNLMMASLMIWAGAILDFFDGFSARMLKAYSVIGKDLDSLADVITFGMLPSAIMFKLLSMHLPGIWPFVGMILVIFGALRLAKFNNDERQSVEFYGLPIPAMAMFVSGLPKVVELLSINHTLVGGALIALALILALLMVSDIKMFSLKSISWKLTTGWHTYLLLIMTPILIFFIQMAALPIIISFYVIFSLIKNHLSTQ